MQESLKELHDRFEKISVLTTEHAKTLLGTNNYTANTILSQIDLIQNEFFRLYDLYAPVIKATSREYVKSGNGGYWTLDYKGKRLPKLQSFVTEQLKNLLSDMEEINRYVDKISDKRISEIDLKKLINQYPK